MARFSRLGVSAVMRSAAVQVPLTAVNRLAKTPACGNPTNSVQTASASPEGVTATAAAPAATPADRGCGAAQAPVAASYRAVYTAEASNPNRCSQIAMPLPAASAASCTVLAPRVPRPDTVIGAPQRPDAAEYRAPLRTGVPITPGSVHTASALPPVSTATRGAAIAPPVAVIAEIGIVVPVQPSCACAVDAAAAKTSIAAAHALATEERRLRVVIAVSRAG